MTPYTIGLLAASIFVLLNGISMLRAYKRLNVSIKCVEAQIKAIESTQHLCNTMVSEYKKNPNSEKIHYALAQYKQHLIRAQKAGLRVAKLENDT